MARVYTELYSKAETPGSMLIWCFREEPIYMTGSLRSNEAILYLIRTSRDMNFTCLDSKLILQRKGYELGFFFHYSWPQSFGKWQDNLILRHSFGSVNDKWLEILLLRSHSFSYWFLLFLPLPASLLSTQPQKCTCYWSDKASHKNSNLLSQPSFFFPCLLFPPKKQSPV